MPDSDVIIVGAGPTGLMLAAELALAGAAPIVVERRPDRSLSGQRAGGLHARTIEIFDQRGIADRFLAEGTTAQIAGFAWMRLDISDFPSRHPYGLALPQGRIEQILADWVEELGAPVLRACEVRGFEQDEAGVDVHLADGRSLCAGYLAGCDGGRSLIRKAAGIDFPGWDPSISCLLAEAELADEPPWGLRRDETGVHAFGRVEEGGPIRIMVTERGVGSGEPGLGGLREALIAVHGTDFGVHSPVSISRFTDMSRQAAVYRKGRVLLAGDAAHIHLPVGGQGLNIGVQDAVNLGWKLAQVVKGVSPDSLLDTYHSERHPVAARVLQNTMAQTALLRGDARTDALRDTVSHLLVLEEPRRRIAAMICGLDVQYPSGEGNPLLGRRMPDLDLTTGPGTARVHDLLREARPILINFGRPLAVDLAPWEDRIRVVDASHEGAWELPVVGAVAAPAAVLVRPDGHVAWVGMGNTCGLKEALGFWFGSPITQARPKANFPEAGRRP